MTRGPTAVGRRPTGRASSWSRLTSNTASASTQRRTWQATSGLSPKRSPTLAQRSGAGLPYLPGRRAATDGAQHAGFRSDDDADSLHARGRRSHRRAPAALGAAVAVVGIALIIVPARQRWRPRP